MPELLVQGKKINIEGQIIPSRPVIFAIHGAGGGAWLWRRLQDAIGNNASLLAIDLPGHGASQGEGASGVSEYREIARAAARELGLSKPILMGHSMGGAIAMDWAINHPDAIEAVVLVSTGARLRVMDAVFQSIQNNYEGYIEAQAKMAFGDNPPADAIDEIKAQSRKVDSQVAFNDFKACDKFDVIAQIGSIKIPTLILCGEKDIMTPLKYSRFLADKISGSILKTFPGAGHILPLERPKEIAEELANFAMMR